MQLPAIVGKYELLEFLGGGMSHVYRARDTVIDRPVVVKLLTDDACRDAEAKARFLQEARLAGNIQHENIVSVFDFGEHEGRPFIVMEYLKGEDLRDAIRAGHTGSLMERMKIALQIAEALEYVNGRGIVHRDIKPENIHIDLKRPRQADGFRHREDRRSIAHQNRHDDGNAVLHGSGAGCREAGRRRWSISTRSACCSMSC